jgi:iron(III) transport system ATP-binding protein
VWGNVAFPAEAAGLGRAEAAGRADGHLAYAELTGFAARKPAILSDVKRHRVALARLILMDEPLSLRPRSLCPQATETASHTD